jgi:hypothetical protein
MVKAIELRKKSTNELLNDIDIYFRVLKERKDVNLEYLLAIINDGLEIVNNTIKTKP